MRDISRLTEKELYDIKNTPQFIEELEEGCKNKSPLFAEKRTSGDFEACFEMLCNDMNICVGDDRYVHFIDFDYRFPLCVRNISPNYDLFIRKGLDDIKVNDNKSNNRFISNCNTVILSLTGLITRIQSELSRLKVKDYDKKIAWFKNMNVGGIKTFEEGLQRMLFLSQLLWQTGSRLVGFGRIDKILYPYYLSDINNGKTREELKNEFTDFLETAHKFYWYKSDVLAGDTGQVMTIGGDNINGQYDFNELSELILEAMTDYKFSDPKIVLRVSKKTPKDVLKRAVLCMKNGNGSPLLSNDEIIIPALNRFGINDDAYDYSTSACWEPLIGGKSSAMNNQTCLVFPKALEETLFKSQLETIVEYSQFEKIFFHYLDLEIEKCEKTILDKKISRNTLYSIFTEGCVETMTDVVDGGALYHNVGMSTVGLGNVVSSLLNIKIMVFKEKRYSLDYVKRMLMSNYNGYEDDLAYIKDKGVQWGKDDEDVIALTNRITKFVSEETKSFRTQNGGKLKFGLSSPSYLFASRGLLASFDGRKKGDAFIVHISNERAQSYTEIINFAGALDYSDNRFNGNVVDLMINPSFIEKNLEKFVSLILFSISVGFFQLQANVVSSETLIEAKRDPSKHRNLMVRVWGFSAYFIQLPEDFQEVLINRAVNNERYGKY